MVTKCKINVQYHLSKTRDKCQYKCSHKLKVIFSARNGIGPIKTFLKFQLCRLVEEEIRKLTLFKELVDTQIPRDK